MQLDDLLELVAQKVSRTQTLLAHLTQDFSTAWYQEHILPNGVYHPVLEKYNDTVRLDIQLNSMKYNLQKDQQAICTLLQEAQGHEAYLDRQSLSDLREVQQSME